MVSRAAGADEVRVDYAVDFEVLVDAAAAANQARIHCGSCAIVRMVCPRKFVGDPGVVFIYILLSISGRAKIR